MAAGTKMVSNGSLCSKKSLGMTSRFELPHRLLTLAGLSDGNSRLDCSGVCAGDVPHSVVLPFLLLHRCRAYRLSAHAGRTDSPSAACERTFWRLVCSAGSGPGYRAHSRADQLPATDSAVCRYL